MEKANECVTCGGATPWPYNVCSTCLCGEQKVTGIDATLAERETRYGDFKVHARITQNIKRAMQDSPNWESISDDKKESLEMVAHKIGRILNGDPTYKDSWHDIIGYTKLVEVTLKD